MRREVRGEVHTGTLHPDPPRATSRRRKPARHPLIDGALATIIIIIGIAIGYVVWGSAPVSSPTVKTTPSTTTPAPSSLSSAALAAKVDPGLVDVNTTLGYENEAAAGTGLVLTSSGRVLTNNHVINGATSISVTDVGNHKTYSATVVGYDLTGDVAVSSCRERRASDRLDRRLRNDASR